MRRVRVRLERPAGWYALSRVREAHRRKPPRHSECRWDGNRDRKGRLPLSAALPRWIVSSVLSSSSKDGRSSRRAAEFVFCTDSLIVAAASRLCMAPCRADGRSRSHAGCDAFHREEAFPGQHSSFPVPDVCVFVHIELDRRQLDDVRGDLSWHPPAAAGGLALLHYHAAHYLPVGLLAMQQPWAASSWR